jgi:uncharacterized Tic20 family protein
MPGEAPSPGYAPPPSPPQYDPPNVPPVNVPPPSGYPASGGYPPAGGGFPPPAGGYPPTGAYYGGPAPAGYANNDDKTWSLLAHFGGPVGVVVGGTLLGWVAPLIAMASRGAQSPTVRAHSVAALNFQITWAIAIALSWVLLAITCGVLFFVPMLIWLVPVIFGIIGGVKANEGQLYRYPASYTFVK